MEKEELKKLNEKLTYKQKNAWFAKNTNYEEIMDFSKKYIEFLNNSKTEREATIEIVKELKENGFLNISEVKELHKGDKVYYINHDKAVYAAKIGDNILDGMNIIGSHIDSPRLDLKPTPLFEKEGMAYLKTHYYGGIKKYQWTTIPLAIKGLITKTNGENILISIGEKEDEPIFTVSDLLPHLAREQMNKRGNNIVEGENLNVTVGAEPLGDIDNAIKLNILKLLNEKYDITEENLMTCELTFVPAFSAKDLGLDRSMVAAYGQDDKSCSYASLKALLESKSNKTVVAIFSDKEEIGSMGNTGMESEIFDMFIGEILEKLEFKNINTQRVVYANSNMISADVDGAYDPNYPTAFEKTNNSILSNGVAICKYTGGGGKYSGSDANAEYLAKIVSIFKKNDVVYQITELGKIDLGGGGTIAYILANKGINVVDCGIAVQSMHSPYEVASKADIMQMYKGYLAFLNEA